MMKKSSGKAQKGGQPSHQAIQVLDPHEAVRARPGMYIGNTKTEGLHSMLTYALNALIVPVEQNVYIQIDADTITLRTDAGHLDIKPGTYLDDLEKHMHGLYTGGCPMYLVFYQDGEKYLPGSPVSPKFAAGMSSFCITTALSSACKITSSDGTYTYTANYACGKLVGTPTKSRDQKPLGCELRYTFDAELFAENIAYDQIRIHDYLQERAPLLPKTTFYLKTETDEMSIHQAEGVIGLVQDKNKGKASLHDLIVLEQKTNAGSLQIYLQWNSDYADQFGKFDPSYVQTFHDHDLMSENDARYARRVLDNHLQDALSIAARYQNLPIRLPRNVWSGLSAVISYKGADIHTRLDLANLDELTRRACMDDLIDWLIAHPDETRAIVDQILAGAAFSGNS